MNDGTVILEYSVDEIKSKINYYIYQINKLEENKKIFSNIIVNIDLVSEKIFSANILLQDVIISKKQYDDGFLLSIIGKLSVLRDEFNKYYDLSSKKIEELNNTVNNLKEMLSDE